jgi:hypothetical protein
MLAVTGATHRCLDDDIVVRSRDISAAVRTAVFAKMRQHDVKSISFGNRTSLIKNGASEKYEHASTHRN